MYKSFVNGGAMQENEVQMSELSQAMQHKALNLNNLQDISDANEGALVLKSQKKNNKKWWLDPNVYANILLLATFVTAAVGATNHDSGGLRWAVFVLALLSFLLIAYMIWFLEETESWIPNFVVLSTFTAALFALVFAIHTEYANDNLWLVFVLDIVAFAVYVYYLYFYV